MLKERYFSCHPWHVWDRTQNDLLLNLPKGGTGKIDEEILLIIWRNYWKSFFLIILLKGKPNISEPAWCFVHSSSLQKTAISKMMKREYYEGLTSAILMFSFHRFRIRKNGLKRILAYAIKEIKFGKIRIFFKVIAAIFRFWKGL